MGSMSINHKRKFENIIKMSTLVGTVILLSLSPLGMSNTYASKSSNNWSWEKALSLKRANHNIDNSSHDTKIKNTFKHIRKLDKRLRSDGYTKRQRLVILALAKEEVPSLKNSHMHTSGPYDVPTYGYFNLIGSNRKFLIKYAKKDHKNYNYIDTQFDYLIHCVKKYEPVHFNTKNKSLAKVTTKLGKELFINPPYKSKSSANQSIKLIKQMLEVK